MCGTPPPPPQNPSTVAEIERLRDNGAEEELQACLGSRMVFGTAGLRAKMAAGYCYMNDLTIIQTTQVPHSLNTSSNVLYSQQYVLHNIQTLFCVMYCSHYIDWYIYAYYTYIRVLGKDAAF